MPPSCGRFAGTTDAGLKVWLKAGVAEALLPFCRAWNWSSWEGLKLLYIAAGLRWPGVFGANMPFDCPFGHWFIAVASEWWWRRCGGC